MPDINKMTPKEVEQYLRENKTEANAVTASSNQIVKLGYSDGCFCLSWSADNIDKYDWVGIYRNNNASDSDYIGSHWQRTSKKSPYQTSLELHAGYQARYLIYDYALQKYRSVARTDPFPPINVRAYS
jgi:hypothetical protein